MTKDPSADPADRIWTVPNAISALRLLLVPVFAWAILSGQNVLAFAILAVAGASDWFDGVLARKLNQTSKLGVLLDPAADRLYIVVTIVCLAIVDVIPWWLVVALVVREAVLGVNILVLRKHGLQPPAVTWLGKTATFVLMYAFPLLLLAHISGPLGQISYVLGWATALWGLFLYWYAAVVYLVQTNHKVKAPAAYA